MYLYDYVGLAHIIPYRSYAKSEPAENLDVQTLASTLKVRINICTRYEC